MAILTAFQPSVAGFSPRYNNSHDRKRLVVFGSSQAMPQRQLEEITSLSNSKVKHCVKIRTQRAYRQESETVLISGADLVQELAPYADIQTIFVMQGASPPRDLPAGSCIAVNEPVMQKITGLESVNSGTVAALMNMPRPAQYDTWREGQLTRLLVLERCQDPGNMGTLLRTALALDWQGALLLPGCADPFNDKSLRASRGAPFKLPMAYVSLEGWQELCRQHNLISIAAEPHVRDDGTDNEQAGSSDIENLKGYPCCLVLGSEGQGLSKEVLSYCTPVEIPMALGVMESLNVAAAGAILMFLLSNGVGKLVNRLNDAFKSSV